MSVLKRPHTWLIAILVIILIVIATRLLLTPRPAEKSGSSSPPTTPSVSSTQAPGDTPPASPAEGSNVPLAPIVEHSAAHDLSDMLSAPDRSPEDKLQAVGEVLYLYRQGFGGENPPGHNELVVSALIGENEKRTALLPKDSPAVKDGALVDPWGTPYWFHAISSRQMEVRSAGPDQELFTEDDLVLE